MAEIRTIEIPIEGMDCADCTRHVNRAISGLDGVQAVEVYLTTEKAVVQLDPQQVVVTLTDFGHPFEPYEPGPPDLETNLENGLAQGFGLHFIYQTMDQIDYETAQDGNHLRFVKQLRTSRGA